jgi:hypothetical protein
MQTQPAVPDITRNIHGGNPESSQANLMFEPHKDDAAEQVYWFVQNHSTATLKQIAAGLKKDKCEISPRITELIATGFLIPTDARHEGCRVLRVHKSWNAAEFSESRKRIANRAAENGGQA